MMRNIGLYQGNETFLSHISKSDVQPNAVDIRLCKLFNIWEDVRFCISNDIKQHRGSYQMEFNEEGPDGETGWISLEPGQYEFVAENSITLGRGHAGFVITRSTLNRNGVFITSGLYDSEYSGVMAGLIHITRGPMMIKKGTRIGQFLMWDAETSHGYNGDYGHGKSHDQKYNDV